MCVFKVRQQCVAAMLIELTPPQKKCDTPKHGGLLTMDVLEIGDFQNMTQTEQSAASPKNIQK